MSGYISSRKSKSGILTQFMEGIENNGQREQYGVVDDSPSRGKPSTRTSDADGRNIPETNLNVSTLLLLYAYSMKDLLLSMTLTCYSTLDLFFFHMTGTKFKIKAENKV